MLPCRRFSFTCVEYCSKWPNVACTPNGTNETAIHFLITSLSREGYPDVNVNQHGTQFETHDFKNCLVRQGCHSSAISHASPNGQFKRFSWTVKGYMQTINLARARLILASTEFIGIYRAMHPRRNQHVTGRITARTEDKSDNGHRWISRVCFKLVFESGRYTPAGSHLSEQDEALFGFQTKTAHACFQGRRVCPSAASSATSKGFSSQQ